LNGSDVTIATVDNAGGTTVMLTLVAHVVLVAGDILTVYGEKIGSGSNPDVAIDSFVLYRVGAEFGTP
jgi:dihydroxyacid dehydratase/phosphogluconate dehydratase